MLIPLLKHIFAIGIAESIGRVVDDQLLRLVTENRDPATTGELQLDHRSDEAVGRSIEDSNAVAFSEGDHASVALVGQIDSVGLALGYVLECGHLRRHRRPAAQIDLHDLHTDMKWSAGLGVRGMMNGLIIRAEVAASKEGMEVQMMITHPFPQL